MVMSDLTNTYSHNTNRINTHYTFWFRRRRSRKEFYENIRILKNACKPDDEVKYNAITIVQSCLPTMRMNEKITLHLQWGPR